MTITSESDMARYPRDCDQACQNKLALGFVIQQGAGGTGFLDLG